MYINLYSYYILHIHPCVHPWLPLDFFHAAFERLLPDGSLLRILEILGDSVRWFWLTPKPSIQELIHRYMQYIYNTTSSWIIIIFLHHHHIPQKMRDPQTTKKRANKSGHSAYTDMIWALIFAQTSPMTSWPHPMSNWILFMKVKNFHRKSIAYFIRTLTLERSGLIQLDHKNNLVVYKITLRWMLLFFFVAPQVLRYRKAVVICV